MRKKIIVAICVLLAGFISGDLINRRKIKKLKEEYQKADDKKKSLLHIAKMERSILETKERAKEVKKYAQLGEKLINLNPEKDACKIEGILTEFMEENDIPCPYEDWSFESFDKFMRDPNNKLVF